MRSEKRQSLASMRDQLELLQEKMKEIVQGLKLVPNFRLKHFLEDL